MNLRNAITRTITYSMVTITRGDMVDERTVLGATTEAKEMMKELKTNDVVPTVKVTTITEKRAMSLDQFIDNSEIIESEEN